MPVAIELQHVSYQYSPADGKPIQALRDISLTFKVGEFVALIGQNGSGKSTLARLLNALLLPDEGQVSVFGLDTHAGENHAAIRAQVGLVFQRPQEQIVGITVEEDVAFGPANLGFPTPELRRRVDEALSVTGLEGMEERPSYLLSAGETQRLALAGVLAMRPRCVVFDETTAMLDPSGRRMVLEQAGRLNKRGITVVLITHLMEEAALASRVVALHQGRLAMDGPPAEVLTSARALRAIGLDIAPAARAAWLLGKTLPEIPPGIWQEEALMDALPAYDNRTISSERQNKKKKNPLLVVAENLSHTYMRGTPLAHQALNQLSVEVAEGSAHGIIGATGCGKSTLLQHINALLRPQSGQVVSCGMNLADPRLDVRALRRQTALAFQQPEDQFFETFVGDEIAFGPRNLLENPNLSEAVSAAMQAVGLDFHTFKDRRLAALSGGEKRKVALASALAARPRLLLLDEPLAGLDPQSRAEIADRLLVLNRQGVTLVVSTHQFEGLVEELDMISVLARGADQLHGRPEEIFSDDHVLRSANLFPPLAARLSKQFIDNGWPLPSVAVSLAGLVRMLGGRTGARGS